MNQLLKKQYDDFKKELVEKENIIIENFKKALLLKYKNISSLEVIKNYYDYKVVFYIDDIKITSNFTLLTFSDHFELYFRFSKNVKEDTILDILQLDFNNLNKVIDVFFKASKFYNVFKTFEKLDYNPISESNSEYSYLSVFKNYRLHYNESFRQQKSITSTPNKSSFIESQFYIVYNFEENKIYEKFKIKFPFLYKSKINTIFSVHEELDNDFFLEEFKKTYKKLSVKHINNVLKLKLKEHKITEEDLLNYIRLVSVLKY